MPRRIPLSPFLFAVWPPLALAARNPGEVAGPAQLLPPMGVGVAAALGAWAVTRLATRDANRRAVAATVLLAWWWWYLPLKTLVQSSPVIHSLGLGGSPGTVSLVLAAAVAWLLARRLPEPAVPGPRTSAVAAALLVVFSASSYGLRAAAGPAVIAGAPAMPPRGHAARTEATPDIYLVILDSYTGRESLLAHYGHDNSGFEDALRTRGFQVPAGPRANYPITSLALASMLNWDYLTALPGFRVDRTASDQDLLLPWIIENRTVRLALQLGYEFVFLSNTVSATTSHPWADVTISGRPPRGWFATYWPRLTPVTDLRRALCTVVACGPAVRDPWVPDTGVILDEKFQALGSLPGRAGPVFALAHLLLPHEPYVYDAGCAHRIPPYWPDLEGGADHARDRRMYLEQLQCTNRRVLDLVDTLLARSAVRPLILLQSDHGFGLSQLGPLGTVPDSLVQERLDIFAAYLTPADWSLELPPHVTPVGALGRIFGRLGGLPSGHLPDRSYWASRQQPFAFTLVREW